MDGYLSWPEIGLFVILIAGFFFALTVITSIFLYFAVIFCFGIMFGRLWFRIEKSSKMPWIIVMGVFLLGYSIASLSKGYGSFLLTGFLYFFGVWIGYMVHKKNVIESI